MIVLISSRLFLLMLLTAVVLLQNAHSETIVSGTTTPPTTFSVVVGSGELAGVTRPPPSQADIHGGPDDKAALISPTPTPNPNGAFCDIWDQDCPPGWKCIGEDLGSEPRCRRLDDSPDSIGEPCSTKDSNDGDTCEEDGICLGGECRELCSGSSISPICDHSDICHIYEDGTPLCEDLCNPYIHEVCGGGSYCSQDSTSPEGRFTCMVKPDLDPMDPELLGNAGESCVETSQCQQAFACLSKALLPNGFCHENSALKCCTPLAEDPNDCPAGMILVDYYSGNAPPSHDYVEVCALFEF